MAYTRHNYLKNIKEILAVYHKEKQYDVPDTKIVNKIFPKYGIHISYRTWVRIKSMKVSELKA